jgi:hypothetical protein
MFGPSELEYNIKAIARPILGNVLSTGTKRVGDGNDILVLPTDKYDTFYRRDRGRQISFCSFGKVQIDSDAELSRQWGYRL